MKTDLLLFLALAALTTLPSIASAQAPTNTTSAEMHQVRLEVKFVEVPESKTSEGQVIATERSTAEGLLAARMKDGAKMSQIALQTTMMQDVPTSTIQQDLIPFVATNNGKPQTNFFPVINSINVTPHFNTDGTLRLSLTIQHSEVLKSDTPQDGPPNVVSQSISTLRTLTSGQPIVLSGFVTGAKSGQVHDAPVGGTEMLVFITATVLPDAAKKP